MIELTYDLISDEDVHPGRRWFAASLILTGGEVKIDIDELEVGSLPGPLNDPLQSFVDDVIEDEAIDLELERDYQLAFSEGAVSVSGQP